MYIHVYTYDISYMIDDCCYLSLTLGVIIIISFMVLLAEPSRIFTERLFSTLFKATLVTLG